MVTRQRFRRVRSSAALALAAGVIGWATFATAAEPQPEAYGVLDRLPPQPAGVEPIDLLEASPLLSGEVEAESAAGIRLAQSTEAVSRPSLVEVDQALDSPPSGRRGLVQGMNFLAEWSPALESDGLGRSTVSGSVGLGVPPVLFGTPLLITPRAAIHTLEGPNTTDVPARLYDLELSFGTFRKLSDRWSARANVSVGVYGDDDSLGTSDALRVSGLGLAIYNASPAWQWAFGAAYLNRDDISVLPVAGVIYNSGAVRYELMMPRPRILWRLPPDGPSGCDRAVYVGGELGGGAWAVRRTTGATDTLNLSRYGLLFGYQRSERGTIGRPGANGWSQRYELGYLFGRDLEYASVGTEQSLDDSFVARASWSF